MQIPNAAQYMYLTRDVVSEGSKKLALLTYFFSDQVLLFFAYFCMNRPLAQ
jgi:hypothetical protein